ncbi:DNA polymerase I [compost metagenome]
MKPLLDSDILFYEIGASGQFLDERTGELVVRDFDYVADLFDQRIKEICAEVWATEPPVLYITNNRRLHKKVNKKLKKEGKSEIEFQPNFRDKVAKKEEYKGKRPSEKPFHYDNLVAYALGKYECRVAVGMEADDLLSADQWARVKEGHLDTIICSRDKDLRITPGMHFGWPCGRQPQYGPRRVSELGELVLTTKKGMSKGKEIELHKLTGNGLKFFYSQVLTGDKTDNYPGIPGCGPVTTFTALDPCETEEELFNAVSNLYKAKYEDLWREEMQEQCQLAWMVRELTEEGQPVMYTMYDERT